MEENASLTLPAKDWRGKTCGISAATELVDHCLRNDESCTALVEVDNLGLAMKLKTGEKLGVELFQCALSL